MITTQTIKPTIESAFNAILDLVEESGLDDRDFTVSIIPNNRDTSEGLSVLLRLTSKTFTPDVQQVAMKAEELGWNVRIDFNRS